jgi:hypothetical protein
LALAQFSSAMARAGRRFTVFDGELRTENC